MSEQNKANKGDDQRKFIKLNRVLAIVICIAMIFVSFMGGYFASFLSKSKPERIIDELISIISQRAYVDSDGKEFDERAFFEFYKEYSGDVHAEYYTAEEYKEQKRQNAGNYQGIGVACYSNSRNTVFKVLKNSPAHKAGIITGDKFISATNGENQQVVFDDKNSVSDYLSEVQNSQSIKFEIERSGEIIKVAVKKQQYTVSYVEYYDKECKLYFEDNDDGKLVQKTDYNLGKVEFDDKTAYISLDQFEGDAAGQLGKAYNFMVERGKTKLILDLRNNTGGNMRSLVDVASYLVRNNGNRESVIAYAKEKDKKTFFSTSQNKSSESVTDIVVLANQNTASASECLIGALIHYGASDGTFNYNNLVVSKNHLGEAKTYGKGIMQTTYMLKSGGAFKLTTAKIYWPNHTTSIHGKGIEVLKDKNGNYTANAVDDQNALSRAIEIMATK